MRVLPTAIAAAGLGLAATPSLAADIQISVELPQIQTAAYHRPYVAIWLETPDQTAVRTLAVWYQQTPNREGDGRDWLKDLRTWWRKGGRAMTMPADGVSGPTRAAGRQSITIPARRLSGVAAGQYNLVVEAAREQGGREAVRVPIRWGAANAGSGQGSTELGAVRVTVTR
ncbi:hypothetical protein ASG17_14400 [Brevundimonas sp. Leaf363]|uniref:DUF2271 domain-containing protein n=1 Tax=Brevundimonas sp. Leaf363 TaxID=1736353 RepID=UPI0006FCF0B4|nr:DUF2271 domain-containing protein [Brevundimonas sp. Leaf363]KQS53706.1 hypothetical protein ASG17_14400 [Brevundimonas sp. Leaf363]